MTNAMTANISDMGEMGEAILRKYFTRLWNDQR